MEHEVEYKKADELFEINLFLESKNVPYESKNVPYESMNVLKKSEYVKFKADKVIFLNVDFDLLSFNNNNNLFINGKMTSLENIASKSLGEKLNLCFDTCKFSKINAKNITWNGSIDIKSSLIGEVNIESSFFKDRFYVNPHHSEKTETCKIKSFRVNNTNFEHNFKLHNCEVGLIDINNTNFKKNVNFFKSKFLQDNKDIIFKLINFEGFTSFGECEFNSKLIFEHVTFKGLSHFREAEFSKGLDLDKTNIENEMIFYPTKGLEKTEYISQETYRIIKYNCQKIGNQIEANKYHSNELKKRREFLNENPLSNKLDWVVFNINWHTSRFSTDWLLTTFWIFIVGFSTWVFVCFSCQRPVVFIDIFKYMSIVDLDECIKKNPLVFLANKTTLGFLYYQLVTAIRKDTRK